MAELLRMPEISANMVEAVLSEWPLAAGASFAAGDAIATVETDKAVVDVPAEADGVLLRTLIEPGKSVTVGTPMAVLIAPGEDPGDVDALVARLTGAAAELATAEPTTAEAATFEPMTVGPVTTGAVTTGAVTRADAPGEPAPRVRTFASPLARRIARENDLDVARIQGTGPGGRIVRDDVRRALAGRTDPATAPQPAVAPQPVASPQPVAAPQPVAEPHPVAQPQPVAAQPSAAGYRDVPHSRMRRAIAERLGRSHRDAPVFSIRGSARVDALLALRRDLNEATDVRISLNDLIVAAAARAHLKVPAMNVVWTPDAVRRFDDVDIAVAVATDNGLVTPVIRGVQRMTVSALAAASGDAVTRARAGRLRQDELEGGTLTVTNLGVFGTEDFTAVINPPQAAILAVGAARPEAVVTDGELGVATVLRVTLSVDHRPVDGATAAQWMAAFLALVESPLKILI